mmetsp:Transcript_116533/g.249197  ORF Transcript_116533/g.249197 Transcript_116533/m.249197 type:complete len:108 (+) Transcript_116533:114-437(+)
MAEPAKDGDDAEAGGKGKDDAEEASNCKLFCFAVLDFLAMMFRCIVASWKGMKFMCQRLSYPIKECILGCSDAWGRWYRPFRAKKPAQSNVPTFGFGHQTNVPDFQY